MHGKRGDSQINNGEVTDEEFVPESLAEIVLDYLAFWITQLNA
jgi:hypothetical protein